MLNIEMLVIWCVPFLQIIALMVLKGWWRIASSLGVLVWTLGWFYAYFIDYTSLLAIIYYVVLMAVFVSTRGMRRGESKRVSTVSTGAFEDEEKGESD